MVAVLIVVVALGLSPWLAKNAAVRALHEQGYRDVVIDDLKPLACDNLAAVGFHATARSGDAARGHVCVGVISETYIILSKH